MRQDEDKGETSLTLSFIASSYFTPLHVYHFDAPVTSPMSLWPPCDQIVSPCNKKMLCWWFRVWMQTKAGQGRYHVRLRALIDSAWLSCPDHHGWTIVFHYSQSEKTKGQKLHITPLSIIFELDLCVLEEGSEQLLLLFRGQCSVLDGWPGYRGIMRCFHTEF